MINRARLWVVMKRLFATVADLLFDGNPAYSEKLRRATPHWAHTSPCATGLRRAHSRTE